MPDKHLTEEQIAVVAEAMNEGRFVQLSNNIKEHIANCDECSVQAVEISEMQKQLELDNAMMLKEKKRQKSARIKLFLGAAAAITLLVASYFLFIDSDNFNNPNNQFAQDSTNAVQEQNTDDIAQNPDNKNQTEKANQIETTEDDNTQVEQEHQIPESPELLAYNENPQLEQLFVRYNSANMRADGIEILNDSIIKIKSTNQLNLKWKDYFGTAYIEVFDNQNNKIISQSTEESQFTHNKNLKKGLYYWKFIDSDFNLLYCGKIEVE